MNRVEREVDVDSNNCAAHTRLMTSALLLSILLLIFAPPGALSMDDPRPGDWVDIRTIGIISPDGTSNLWAVSTSSGSDIMGLLAKHPFKIKNGIRFYRVSSWKDLAGVLTAVNHHQAQVIRQLAQGVQQLTKRVGRIEKIRPRHVSTGSANSRLKRLEKKVDDMFDGGNP